MSILVRSESIVKLAAALRAAKLEFGKLVKNQENPGFKRGNKVSKYADLSAVLEATEGALEKHGILLTQFPVADEARVGVRSILVHESGESMQEEFYLSLGKLDAQAGAGAVTYARRVAMKAILGLTDEDDDGNTASRKDEEPAEAKPATKQAAKAPAAASQNVKSETKAAVPKAEIPKTTAKGGDAPAEDNGALPNEAEMKNFRKQFVQFVDKIEEAGVEGAKSNPVQKQALKYLLATTSAARPEDITKSQWRAFFVVTDMALATKESAAELVSQIK
jgi:soluble cytochrome b562